MSRLCSDCGTAPLGPKSKSGACKRCLLARQRSDPAFEARRLARLAEANGRPETRARNSQSRKAYYARNPQAIEALREHGYRTYAHSLGSEKCRQAGATPEVRAIIAAKAKERADAAVAWCPPAYRDEFRALLRKRKMNATSAKKIMIEERIPRFEFQMWRVLQGAGISTKPNLSKSYDYTLAGGSPL